MNSSINKLYSHYLAHPQITTDSRALIKGAIFFALKGDHFDGNKFALQSIQQGCSLAVVDDIELKDQDKCFYVENVLSALQSLARHHRNQLDIPIIGITGTNGKTTTKELVSAVLSKKLKTYATQGNFNNHIGVPLSILSIKKNDEIAVIEMGANHIGEIANLCQIAKPNYGIITNIGIAHLEGFGSFEGVKKAKTELYNFLKTQPEAIAFVHQDDPLLIEESRDLNRFTYGFSQEADVKFKKLQTEEFAAVTWQLADSISAIKSKLIGSFNMPNLMAAISIGNYFKVPDFLIKEAIEEYSPANKRSQLLKTINNQIIVDAYNANPSSMKLAIDNFTELKADQKLFILGDMLELGIESKNLHQEIINHLAKYEPKEVILIGLEFHKCKLQPHWLLFKTTDEALNYLTSKNIKNHHILLKGSRGMQLEKLIDTL